MMDFLPFLLAVGAIVAAIVVVKVFFTLWRILEKRLHPEQYAKPAATPEFVFRRLHGKKVTIVLKNGECLQDCDYQSTHLFGDGEFAFRACKSILGGFRNECTGAPSFQLPVR